MGRSGTAATCLPGVQVGLTPVGSTPSFPYALRSGFEGYGGGRPVSCGEAGVLGYPGDADGGGAGSEEMAPAVVLVDGFGAALIFSVERVGIEVPAGTGESCASVEVPNDFGKDEFAGFGRRDRIGPGQIASVRLRAGGAAGGIQRGDSSAGHVVQKEAEVSVGGAPVDGETQVSGRVGISGVEGLRDIVASLNLSGTRLRPGIVVVVGHVGDRASEKAATNHSYEQIAGGRELHDGRIGEGISGAAGVGVIRNIFMHKMDDAHAGRDAARGARLQENARGDPLLAGAHGESGIHGAGGAVHAVLSGPTVQNVGAQKAPGNVALRAGRETGLIGGKTESNLVGQIAGDAGSQATGRDGRAGALSAGAGAVDSDDVIKFGGHGLNEAAGIGTEANGDEAGAGGNVEGRGNADGLRVRGIEIVDLHGLGVAHVVVDGGSGIAIESEADHDSVSRGGEIGKLEVVAIRAGKGVVDRASTTRIGTANMLYKSRRRSATARSGNCEGDYIAWRASRAVAHNHLKRGTVIC